jgi:hypothetical protein
MVATSAQASAVREVCTIRLFTSEYELDNFPYDTALEIFLAKKNRRGVGLSGRQRSNAGITGALDLDLLAQGIRDNE